ncbi:arv1-like protein [Neofusicoccum parvum]|uniref:Arv1-like protein n=1 Tax=Neofusicoccum parvum TaxID=310453 RepID=A0ACB5S0D7_9PEZI|nr:arv1-like protein [Neofusicoccum parvum]
MPICIECRYPLRALYTTYSKADDRALGKGVRLTQCPRCKRFGDKYVEHDFVVLFIDLVLIKPQPSIIRLGILLLLFDVYLTWARIEKAAPPLLSPDHPSSLLNSTAEAPSLLSTQPLVLQYIFFLGLCTAQTLAFHLPIRLLCSHPPRIRLPNFLVKLFRTTTTTAPTTSTTAVPLTIPPATITPSASGTTTPTASFSSASTTGLSTTSQPTSTPQPSFPPNTITLIPHYPHPTPLSTALLVSSCTKLFPLLLIIWDYDLPSSASAVSWAVIVNNIAALEILMDCGYLRAGLLVGVGALVRAVVGEVVLASVGLRGRGASAAGWEELFGWGEGWLMGGG